MDRQYFKSNKAPRDLYHNTVAHTLSIIAEAIGTTFGPFGHHNVFKNGPDIRASKDGLENLSMLKFDSSIPEAVYTMALELATDQANQVGDGTTTAVLVMAEVYKYLMITPEVWQFTPSTIFEAMSNIQTALVERLENNAMSLNKNRDEGAIQAILDTTLNGDTKLVDILTDMVMTVNNIEDRNILLDYSPTSSTYFSTVHGINAMAKLMSPLFGNQADDMCTLRNVDIILVDGKVNIMNDILTHVNQLKPLNKSLLIICSGVNENFYRYIEAISQTQAKLLNNFCVVYSDANTINNKEMFKDIQYSVDTVYLPENMEISAESIKNIGVGFAENVCIKNGRMTIGNCRKGEQFNSYVEGIKRQIFDLEAMRESASSEERAAFNVDLPRLRAQYERLVEGVTTLYAGGDNYQNKHMTFRAVEDGVKAIQSSLKHGYFQGCNVEVLNCIVGMMAEEAATSNSVNRIYYILLKALLNAYVSVYKRLITNRVRATDDDSSKLRLMLCEGIEDEFMDICNGISPQAAEIVKTRRVFDACDLTGAHKEIFNPAQTDINIVRKAITSATTLATSMSILTDKIEFEAVSDNQQA